MRFVFDLAAALSLSLTFVVAPLVAQSPPVAPVREVIDEYWGVKVSDPYRYFENLDDPEVQAWFAGQARFADSVLATLPDRDAIAARIAELDAGRPFRISKIRRLPSGKLFYYRQAAEDNLAKLYQRQGLSGNEELLIDPADFSAPDGGHYSLYFYEPSPDGRYIIYGLAASGSEAVILHLYDVEHNQQLPLSLDRLEPYYTPPQWLPDGSGFFYNRLRLLAADAPATDGYKRSQTFLHRLGSDPADDPVVFDMKTPLALPVAAEDFPSVVLTLGSDYAIGKVTHGDANEYTLYAAPLATVGTANTPWRLICDVPDSVVDFAVHGDDIYLLTAKDAPRFRLVRTSLTDPSFSTAQEIVSVGESVLQTLNPAQDALYLSRLTAGMRDILRVDYNSGSAKLLEFPDGAPSGSVVSSDIRIPGILAETSTWTRRGLTYLYNPDTGTFTDSGLNPPGKYDNMPGFESVEVMVPGHDGVEVPLSIIYKSGTTLDGSNPTLIRAYGAYGISQTPYFSASTVAWLERGGIAAVAHVRGGGEFGQEWHLAGQKATKPNTWKDFIACAEYLIAAGYTSKTKLAGRGGSAGGITIGRAITERPDLFAAAIINVGDEDMVRVETTTNGVPNIQEFGTVTKEDEFHALLEMSAYHHVKDGVAYPAVLLTHGINDPRVDPWLSAKMCARLQAATSSGKPVLFRVDYFAGHGIGSTRAQQYSQTADEFAFLLWQLGEN